MHDKQLRIRYIRVLEKFFTRTLSLLKLEDFNKELFIQRTKKNFEDMNRVKPIDLHSNYLIDLKDFINKTMSYINNPSDTFEEEKAVLLKDANLLQKEKRKNLIKKRNIKIQNLMMDTNGRGKKFKLSGVLKKVFYKNEETKFITAVLENNQRICGVYFDTDIDKIVGEEIVLTGNWITHKKYGIQFVFDTLEIKEAELYFFLTKIVKGVGEKFAKDLLDKYSEEELIKILNEKPEELLSFKGIKEKKLNKIVASWQKFQHLRELGSFLSKYGVSSNLITKIYSNFGEVEDLIEKIKTNPYILINIKGVGFKKADEIAKSLGIDERSEFRIMACLNYTLKEFCDNNGNSSIDKYHLYRLLDESLRFSHEDMLYENCIVQMLADEDLFTTKENRVAISMLYNAEKNILDFFKRRKDERYLKSIVSNIDDYIEKKKNL